MTIEIDTLSYEELLKLKHMIDRRIAYLDSHVGIKRSLPFQPGDTVSFAHPQQGRLTGTLIQYNEKTVTILTTSGQQWDVSPNLLRNVKGSANGEKGRAKIIDIGSRQV